METGIIQKIINDEKALIKIENPGDCDLCQGKSYCNIFKSKDNTIEVNYSGKLNIGDHVTININAKKRIISSILIFIIPIILLITFYYIFFYFFKKESLAIIGGIIIFLLYFVIVIIFSRTKKEIKNFRPFVTKI